MSKKRILVVDDDAQVRKFLRRLLEEAGFAVEVAEGGEAALARVAADPPDLVSLDLVMPEVDGWKVLERLEAAGAAPPVVLLTGLGYEGASQQLRPPVVGLVHKADDPRVFVATCRRVLAGMPTDDSQRPGAERRKARRRPLIIPVRVLTPLGMTLGEGRLVRVSPIGADLECEAALPAGATVRFSIPLPGREAAVLLDGEIHKRGRAGDTYIFGVSFVNPPPALRELLGEAFSG
jgi:CheY-like chemotaxis protein